MNSGKTIFAQIMEFLPSYEFNKCIERYKGNYQTKSFSCLDQFFCMAFAQLTYRESLRDIEACLRAQYSKLYHMGIRGTISKSNLSYANEHRDWRIYAEFAQVLIGQARALYKDEDLGLELEQTVYALDSSTIDLCLSLFPWARFRKHKAAIKLHTLMDLRGSIPSFIKITDGKVHDVNILDILLAEPGSFYIMDRGYLDFARLYSMAQSLAFFVIRAKNNLAARRMYSHQVDRSTGLICDQTIVLTGHQSAQQYPDKLRRVRYFDAERNKHLVFLTNCFFVPAITIPLLYKNRWQIELFFKWIKQNLRIKSFYGTSENAVKTQIWIAISVYTLIAIIKKRLKLSISLYTFLQILSVTVFEKTKLIQLVECTNYNKLPDSINAPANQLKLFDVY